MKKMLIYISITALIIVITTTGTYAFFSASTNTGNGITSEAANLEVIYTGGTAIQGTLNLVRTKEEGFNTTVNIRLTEDSIDAMAKLYIKINDIGETIANDALNWEVYKDNSTTAYAKGTFNDYKSGDKVYIVNNYDLSTTNTSFKIYIWLNGEQVGNEVLGATLDAYIGAETEIITTQLSNS